MHYYFSTVYIFWNSTISFIQLSKLVAVSRLVAGNNVQGHCTHEPNLLVLSACGNLIWAEVDPNPRDIKTYTSEGRGQSALNFQKVLKNACFKLTKEVNPACY